MGNRPVIQCRFATVKRHARGRTRTGTELPPRDFKSLVSTNSTTRARSWSENGGWGRNRTGVDGFAGRCITTLPPSQSYTWYKMKTPSLYSGLMSNHKTAPDQIRSPPACCPGYSFGAGNETRTRDIHVGNVMLYQLSYSRNNHPFNHPPWLCLKAFPRWCQIITPYWNMSSTTNSERAVTYCFPIFSFNFGQALARY